MFNRLLLLEVLLLAFAVGAWGQGSSFCPVNAVFLALTDYTTGLSQVRGYPTRANGPTAPCQVLQGAQTTLSTANGLSISVHGDLHVVQFLTNGTVAVFPPAAAGNTAPERIESTYTNDLLAVATDSHVNDFALSRREGPAAIAVILNKSTVPAYSINAPGFQASGGLAVDEDNNLIVAGYDSSYNGFVETLGTSLSLSAPGVVRTLGGVNTGLLPGNSEDFSNNTISVAVDPESGELYIYTFSPSSGQSKVSVFPVRSNGNVKPSRVISGALTQIGAPGELNNKIAVSADGRLFVAEPNDRILVFAAGAAGNVTPAQIIQDSTLGKASMGQGGIAVRSCGCN